MHVVHIGQPPPAYLQGYFFIFIKNKYRKIPLLQALIFSRENVHFAFYIDIKDQFTTTNLHDFFGCCQAQTTPPPRLTGLALSDLELIED